MNVRKLVKHCDNNFQKSKTKCDIIDCDTCLKEIHFNKHQGYDCKDLINYYVCKYMYRHSSEIQHIFNANKILLKKLNYIDILSLGCGPCSELMGLNNCITSTKDIRFMGIDINNKWQPIHNFISKKSNDIQTNFIYDNIFNISKYNSYTKYNILILQYVLSDMNNYHSKQDILKFIEKLVECVIVKMEPYSLIIINDINHYTARNYFSSFETYMKKNNLKFTSKECSFKNDYKESYYHYGYEYISNALTTKVPSNIQEYYNPWMSCSSAQIIIRKD